MTLRPLSMALAATTLAAALPAIAGTPVFPADQTVYKPQADWQWESKPHGTLVKQSAVANSVLTSFTVKASYTKPLLAWRVAYTTTSPDPELVTTTPGRPQLATGIVISPATAWTGSGERPIIVFSPKTQGIGSECAPSKALEFGREEISEVRRMVAALEKGYAIAVTDYDGYTENSQAHQYLVGQSLGHAVLDMALATRQLVQDTNIVPSMLHLSINSPMALWGYSEGGVAAAWGGQLMSSYAPSLVGAIKAVATGGTVADMRQAAKSLDSGPGAGMMLSGVWGFHVAYPKPFSQGGLYFEINDNFKHDLVGDYESIRYALNPPSTPQVNYLLHAAECVDQLPLDHAFKSMYWRNKGLNGSGPFTITQLTTDPALRWENVVRKNDPGNMYIPVPVYFYHGSTATSLNTDGTAKEGDFILSADSLNGYYNRMCATGTRVWKEIYPSTSYGDSNHESTSDKAFDSALYWLSLNLAGVSPQFLQQKVVNGVPTTARCN